jgi:predicted GNAT family acetyltransferase
MELTRYSDVTAFYQRAEPYLMEHEAEHCLMLGICGALLCNTQRLEGEPYLATVEHEGAVVAVALRTPPYNIVLSLPAPGHSVEQMAALVAADARAVYGMLPGVFAPSAISRAFADAWQQLTGQSYSLTISERTYQLDRVIPVNGVPGTMRRAQEADRALLVRWIAEFSQEALVGEQIDPEQWADEALASLLDMRGLYVWEDGEPVTMVGYQGPTPHGMRIGPVYTPPEQRRKGYASACTAALSQHLLDGGRRFCFLYTDLANKTSNHVYKEIGYQPVADVDMYTFGEP